MSDGLRDLRYLEFDESKRNNFAFQAEFRRMITSVCGIPIAIFNKSTTGSYVLPQGNLSTQRIRDIVRTKAYFIDIGHPDLVTILSILNGERNHYIHSLNGSLKAYISEMLGPSSTMLCNMCRVFLEDKTEVEIPRNYRYSTIQKYLSSEHTTANLPYKIIIDGIIERYL